MLVLTTTLPARVGDATPSFVLDLALCMNSDFDQTIVAPRLPDTDSAGLDEQLCILRYPYFFSRLEGLAADAIVPTLRRSPWRILEAPFLVWGMLRSATMLASKEEFAAVIAHWAFPGGWVAQRLHKRYGIPFTVTLHGADVFALRGRLFKRLRKRVFDEAAAILPVSSDIASAVEDEVQGAQLQVIPMGALVEDQPSGVARFPDRFLFVGRLAEKKGVDVAIRALSCLQKGTLLVIGSGPEEESLRRLAREVGVSERVIFAGKLGRADVFKALQEATALLIPSRVASGGDKDGTPVVLAEAAAMGTPVIASNLAGLAEQIRPGFTGLTVNPDDFEELASAMESTLADPERARAMGQAARSDFQSGPLNMRMTAKRYSETLRKVLRQR